MSEVDLYRIVAGARVWTITSAATAQKFDAGSGLEFYEPVAMGRTAPETKNSLQRSNLDVRLPLGHELSIFALSFLYDDIVTLTVFTDDGVDVTVQWKGRLLTKKPDDNSVTLSFESVFTSMRRPGLRARFQRSCRWALYFRGCNLDKDDWRTDDDATSLVGNVVSVPAAAGQANGYYIGGMLGCADGTLAYIINHVGVALTLQRVPYSLTQQIADGDNAVSIYPGCDHTRATCKAKFDNLLNYGGFDWIPVKNPMGGSSIV